MNVAHKGIFARLFLGLTSSLATLNFDGIGLRLFQPIHDVRRVIELRDKAKVILVAYLAHFVVPLFLVFDVLAARLLGHVPSQPGRGDTIVLGISVLWLTSGCAVFLFKSDRSRFLERASGPLTGMYAIYLSLILVELLVRVAIGPTDWTPAVWPPGSRWVSEVDPRTYPGVQGVKAFTVNKIGLRGASLAHAGNVYKVVTIGGSTTECLALDDSEEWPHLLMQELNSRQRRYPVWVGNAGVGGHNTVHHLVLLQSLPVLKQVDLLIFLTGINDLQATLAFEGAPTQTDLEQEASNFREYRLTQPRPQYPLYKRLQLFQLSKKLADALVRRFKPQSWTYWLSELPSFRKQRAEAPVVPLPDLQIGLQEYRGRVLGLARQCRILGVRCLFLTQPTMWRADLTPAEQRLLWSGNVGRWKKPRGYASAADLARAMDAYNRVLLEVCGQNGLECDDLASLVPKDTSAFFDHCHFNEAGARIVAHHLVDYLLSRPPFEKEH